MPKNAPPKPQHERETLITAISNDIPLSTTIRRLSIQARHLANQNTVPKSAIHTMLLSSFFALKWLSEFEKNSCREQFLDALIAIIMHPDGVEIFLSLCETFLKDN
jgi:hypothetical protein